MKINRSLYGLVQIPLYWLSILKKTLEDNGFKKSEYEHILFYGKDMVTLYYVDDVIFFGTNQAKIDNLISKLEKDGFNLTKEKDLFLLLRC